MIFAGFVMAQTTVSSIDFMKNLVNALRYTRIFA
jgi:hypothetical protein